MTKEALRLALGALQRFIKYDYNETPFDGKDVEGAEAIAAIKAALAQPEGCQCPECQIKPHTSDCAVHNEPAYPKGRCDCGAQPEQEPQRKPLTDEEIYKIYRDCGDLNVKINIARAIEAKLKELNT
jgi:hypothetical protein